MTQLVFKIGGVTKAEREFATEAEATAAAVEGQVQAIPGYHHWSYDAPSKTWTSGNQTMQMIVT